jgi:hypothetical protein
LDEGTDAVECPPVPDEAHAARENPDVTEEATDAAAGLAAATGAEKKEDGEAALIAESGRKAEKPEGEDSDFGVEAPCENGEAGDPLLAGFVAGEAAPLLTEARKPAYGEAPEVDTEISAGAGQLKPTPKEGRVKGEAMPAELAGGEAPKADAGADPAEETAALEVPPEADGGDPGVKASRAEDSPFTTEKPACEKAVDTADFRPKGADVLVRTEAGEAAAASAKSADKKGGAPSDGEKKSSRERARRTAAGGRIDGGTDSGAARAAQAPEARRVSAVPPEAEITVNLRGEPRGAAAGGLGGGGGAKPAASFETLLAGELRQNLNAGIVKQAQVLLRESGEGTIRLSLKPESLGKVKIHLEMAENKITGKIVVESGEALYAFEREMESLEQTFRGEGFDGASLSLELAEHQVPEEEKGGRRQNGERVSSRIASSRYGEAVGKSAYLGAFYSAKQINVLV